MRMLACIFNISFQQENFIIEANFHSWCKSRHKLLRQIMIVLAYSKSFSFQQRKFKFSVQRQGRRLKTRGGMLDLLKTYSFKTVSFSNFLGLIGSLVP
jgi:hypothetical protein